MVESRVAPAAGILAAGLILWLHTFQALGFLPFAPTAETSQTFFAWTMAMLAAPLVVIASALLIALSDSRWPARVGLLVTTLLAARVWENVEGFLVPNDNPLPTNGTPLKFEQWPFVYHHGWWVFGGVAAVAVLGIVYAGWRSRPRVVPLIVSAIVAVAVIAVLGNFGFAAMSFLRLRNWAIAVAVVDLFVVRWRFRRQSGGMAAALQIALLLVIVAAIWQLHVSWTTFAAEMPKHVETPWW